MRQTLIHIVISILIMIGHYKQLLLIKRHNIVASTSQEKLFFPPFSLESKFFRQMRETWMIIIICILFVTGHHKHILFIGMHDIDAWFPKKKCFFAPFSLESKFFHQIKNMDSYNNFHSFCD